MVVVIDMDKKIVKKVKKMGIEVGEIGKVCGGLDEVLGLVVGGNCKIVRLVKKLCKKVDMIEKVCKKLKKRVEKNEKKVKKCKKKIKCNAINIEDVDRVLSDVVNSNVY